MKNEPGAVRRATPDRAFITVRERLALAAVFPARRRTLDAVPGIAAGKFGLFPAQTRLALKAFPAARQVILDVVVPHARISPASLVAVTIGGPVVVVAVI